MNLSWLQILVQIEESQTLSKAAEVLHISQPALSRSMAALEEELGMKLFTRTKNSIAFNEAGKLALNYARRILQDVQEMEEGLAEYDRKQKTIAIQSDAPAPLWNLLPVLSALYPGVPVISNIEASGKDILSRLKNGQIHLAIVRDYVLDNAAELESNPADPDSNPDSEPGPDLYSGLLCVPYMTEHLYLCVPPAHPLAHRTEIHLSELNGESFLLLDNLGFWESLVKTSMPKSRFIVQSDLQDMDELIRSSMLPCFGTDYSGLETSLPNRVRIPVADPQANPTFYLCLDSGQKDRFESLLKRIHANTSQQ